MNGLLTGLIMGVAATVLWSLTPPMIRVGLRYVSDPVMVSGIRVAAALAAVAPAALVTNSLSSTDLSYWVLALVAASAALGPGLGDVSYTFAIKKLGAGLAVIISYQYIMIAQLISVAALGDTRGAPALLLTPLALLGVYLAVKDSEGEKELNIPGVAYAIVAAVAWGVSTVLVSYVVNFAGLDPLPFTLLRTAFLAPPLLIIGALRNGESVRRLYLRSGELLKGLAIVASSGVLAYFAGFLLFATAVKVAGVVIPSLATAATPVLTQLLSAKLASEEMGKGRLAGSVLVAVVLGIAAILA